MKIKCLIFGANIVARKMIADYNKEHGNTLALWFAEDLAMRRTDFLSQYIAYHNPGWVVYAPVIQTVGSVDSCIHQLARLVDIASQGQVHLAVLVSRSLVENMMEVVHLHYVEHNVEQFVNILADGQRVLGY